MYIDANVTDANGAPVGGGHGGLNCGGTLSIHSSLTNVLGATPQTGISGKRIRRASAVPSTTPAARVDDEILHQHLWKNLVGQPASRPLYEKGPVDFAVGPQYWNITSSACSVGGWDNGNANDFSGALIFGGAFVPVIPSLRHPLI